MAGGGGGGGGKRSAKHRLQFSSIYRFTFDIDLLFVDYSSLAVRCHFNKFKYHSTFRS